MARWALLLLSVAAAGCARVPPVETDVRHQVLQGRAEAMAERAAQNAAQRAAF